MSSLLLNSGMPPERPSSDVVLAQVLPPDSNALTLIDWRRGQVRRREYRALGLIEKIMLEKSAPALVGDDNPLVRLRAETSLESLPALAVSIDYYKQGPLAAIGTLTSEDIFICSKMVHPPDLPDPDWTPPYPPTEFNEEGFPIPPKPPRLPQRMRDRASGIMKGETEDENDFWFVCQPVHQVLLILADKSGLGMIECQADATGRHTAFLWNPAREEGHLLYGAKRVEFYH